MNIEKITEETGANIVIIADKDGSITDATDMKHAKNFALMTQTAFSMCHDLLNDITGSNLEQLIARSSENVIIVNRLDSGAIVLIASDNPSKFGLLLKYMNSINNN
ncbi:roadblock/LC7 domain-containing protein [Bizionia argentinensis]|nr:roadblock/LC7 domain-containing protein [Bizionia argentinensis]